MVDPPITVAQATAIADWIESFRGRYGARRRSGPKTGGQWQEHGLVFTTSVGTHHHDSAGMPDASTVCSPI